MADNMFKLKFDITRSPTHGISGSTESSDVVQSFQKNNWPKLIGIQE